MQTEQVLLSGHFHPNYKNLQLKSTYYTHPSTLLAPKPLFISLFIAVFSLFILNWDILFKHEINIVNKLWTQSVHYAGSLDK